MDSSVFSFALVKYNPHPHPPEYIWELALTGVKTKKMPHPMGTLFANIQIRYDITV